MQFDFNGSFRKYFSSDHFQKNFYEFTKYKLGVEQLDALTKSEYPYKEYEKICLENNLDALKQPLITVYRSQEDWHKRIEGFNNLFLVCSFTTKLDSILMWSHYADNYKGIVIEYDFRNTPEVKEFLSPVYYTSEALKTATWEEVSAISILGASLEKAKEWEYEQEWRLMTFTFMDKGNQKKNIPTPKAIYLGINFDKNNETHKTKLIEVAKNKGIKIYQMMKNISQYKLEML